MITYNYPLLHHNSFGFDIKAERYFDYHSREQLKEFLGDLGKEFGSLLHIGLGSNLLFTGDYKGTVLHSSIRSIRIEKETGSEVFVRVGSGVIFDDFCREMTELNFGGVENLSLIPSHTGAAAVQNIGAYGVELKDVVESVDAIEIATRRNRRFTVSDCGYGYRNSIFKGKLRGKYIITSVLFRLAKNPKPNIEYAALRNEFPQGYQPTIEEVRDAVIRVRNSKLPDPKHIGNAGSFFKNPYCSKAYYKHLCLKYPDMPHYEVSAEEVKIPAAYLIEQCGFKGKRFGNVGAYEKQPLVLVNYGGAAPIEIVELARMIEEAVKEKFGIPLEPEVIYV